MESIYDHAGGHDVLHHFVDVFYSSVLADPLMHPLFGAGKPEHVGLGVAGPARVTATG
jgi:hemoglobin